MIKKYIFSVNEIEKKEMIVHSKEFLCLRKGE